MVSGRTYRLLSGYDVPVLGLGTWRLVGEDCVRAVRAALELGYRHIDTAELYENEAEIGRALAGVEREEIFITSKVSDDHFGKADIVKACEGSLGRLGVDYLDLYLLHWPNDAVDMRETFEGLGQLVDKGQVRSVGLSNFDVGRIEQVLAVSGLPISNLQIEYHPLTKRAALPEFCAAQGIIISAYCPIARGRVYDDVTMVEVAEKYEKTAAQVSLRWLVQKGAVVIPKASSEEHLAENMGIFDWQLSDGDMARIDGIGDEQRLVDRKYT